MFDVSVKAAKFYQVEVSHRGDQSFSADDLAKAGRYTTADGLASNAVNDIAADPRGFLWFATPEGLSRFDGYGFLNETTSTGLPAAAVDAA